MPYTPLYPGLIPLEAAEHAYTDTAGTIRATANNAQVACLKNGGINLTQATSSARPLLKTGIGAYSSVALDFDGVNDRLRDDAATFGNSNTFFMVGRAKKRAKQNQGLIDVAGVYLMETQGSSPVIIKNPSQYYARFSSPNYQCVRMWSIKNGSSVMHRIDDKTPILQQTGVSFTSGTGLTIGDAGTGNCGAFEIIMILVHPTYGMSDSEIEAEYQNIKAYYGGELAGNFALQFVPALSEGNSYSSAGANAGQGAGYTDNSSEYTIKAALAVGGIDMRCVGMGGASSTGTNGNSLTERYSWVRTLPEKWGSTRQNSILLAGELTNQPGASGFTAFKAYIDTAAADGWGQIIAMSPAASGYAATGQGSTGDTIITQGYDAFMAATWASNVRVADMRQGVIATYSPTYFNDYAHWNAAGHAAAATLLQPHLLAAKLAILNAPATRQRHLRRALAGGQMSNFIITGGNL